MNLKVIIIIIIIIIEKYLYDNRIVRSFTIKM